jgi:hypothetical protein
MYRPFLCLPLLLCSCATDRLFAPRENVNGTGPSGMPAAVYQLAPPANGEVRVWSEGAECAELDGGDATRLHVGFELENNGSEPLVLESGSVHIEGMATEQGNQPALQPRIAVRTEAPPGKTARLDLEFAVDPEVMPRTIRGFEVHWRVVAGAEGYSQVTPFQPFIPYYYYDCCGGWPYYGYGYGWGFGWGFGLGYAWHCH